MRVRGKEAFPPKYWMGLPINKKEFKSDHEIVISLPPGVFLSQDSTKSNITLADLCILQGSPQCAVMLT